MLFKLFQLYYVFICLYSFNIDRINGCQKKYSFEIKIFKNLFLFVRIMFFVFKEIYYEFC